LFITFVQIPKLKSSERLGCVDWHILVVTDISKDGSPVRRHFSLYYYRLKIKALQPFETSVKI